MPEPPLSLVAGRAGDPQVRSSKPDAQRLAELRLAFARSTLTRDQMRELLGIAERALRDRERVREVMVRMASAYREVQTGLHEISRTVTIDR